MPYAWIRKKNVLSGRCPDAVGYLSASPLLTHISFVESVLVVGGRDDELVAAVRACLSGPVDGWTAGRTACIHITHLQRNGDPKLQPRVIVQQRFKMFPHLLELLSSCVGTKLLLCCCCFCCCGCCTGDGGNGYCC